METRLTLQPGQPGTRKLVARYGERLVRARRDDEVVYVRIAYHEADLRARAKRLGAIWRQAQLAGTTVAARRRAYNRG